MNTYSQMDVRLRKNENIEIQFKPEIMLYLVVDGSAELKIKDRPWKMAKDDFILVNAGLMHSVTCEKEGTILCASLRRKFLVQPHFRTVRRRDESVSVQQHRAEG